MKSFFYLSRTFLRLEFACLERFLSPVLLAAVLLVVFSFAFGNIEADFQNKIFVAITFVTIFISLQMSFSRVFDHEIEDGVVIILRAYNLNMEVFYFSKLFLVFLISAIQSLTIMWLALLFLEVRIQLDQILEVFILSLLSVAGLSAIGVLLAGITLRSLTRQILFPLLYFPLTVPVLLASVEGSLAILESEKTLTNLIDSWVGMLFLFDMIYITLGSVLFREILKGE